MKRVLIGLIFAVLSSVTGPVSQAGELQGSLQFLIQGLNTKNGKVGLNLFRSDDEMFAHPYKSLYAEIVDNQAVIIVEGLSYGKYAAVAYHDVNDNGRLDHHFLGYPDEPIA